MPLNNAPERLIEVYALKGRDDKRLQPLLNELHRLGITIQFVNRQTLDKKQRAKYTKVSWHVFSQRKN